MLVLGLSLAACAPPSSSEGESGQTVTTQAVSETESGAPTTVTATTTGEGTGTETGTETGTMTFVPDNDIAALYGICDPFGQDCPEGEKCVPYDPDELGEFGTRRCVEVMGSQAAGEPCTYAGMLESTDDCDESSFCYPTQELEGVLQGTCAAFCLGTADDPLCPAPTSCVNAFSNALAVCLDACDPLLQDCEAPLACHWAGEGFNCTPVAAVLGEPCSLELDNCDAGQVCVGSGFLPMCAGEKCCTEYCDLADPACTLPGTACTAFFEPQMALEGLEDLGVCAIN